MWKKLKDRAVSGAMKVASSDRARKVMDSDEFQSAVFRAVTTGLRVKRDLAEARRVLAKQLDVATGDDLADLKRELDRLERRVRNLRDENDELRDQLDPDDDARQAS
jgi:hypothetical protein